VAVVKTLLQGDLTGYTKGRSLENLPKSNGLSEIENHSRGKYFHLGFVVVISCSNLLLRSKTIFWRV
jgi:hypothetical protein